MTCILFLSHRNIEDILAEKGETVRRLSDSDSLEFLVEDMVNKSEEKERSEDKEKT